MGDALEGGVWRTSKFDQNLSYTGRGRARIARPLSHATVGCHQLEAPRDRLPQRSSTTKHYEYVERSPAILSMLYIAFLLYFTTIEDRQATSSGYRLCPSLVDLAGLIDHESLRHLVLAEDTSHHI